MNDTYAKSRGEKIATAQTVMDQIIAAEGIDVAKVRHPETGQWVDARTYMESQGTGRPGDAAEIVIRGQTRDKKPVMVGITMDNSGTSPVVSVNLKKGNVHFVAEYATEDDGNGRAKLKMVGATSGGLLGTASPGRPDIKYYSVDPNTGRRSAEPLEAPSATVQRHFANTTNMLLNTGLLEDNSFRKRGKIIVGETAPVDDKSGNRKVAAPTFT